MSGRLVAAAHACAMMAVALACCRSATVPPVDGGGGLGRGGAGAAEGGASLPEGRWTALPDGGPSAASEGVAVWSGRELLLWGGSGPCTVSGVCGDGARLGDAGWAPIAQMDAPLPRALAASVWTTSGLFVWGGRGCGRATDPCGNGGLYDPARNSWSPVSVDGAPTARQGAVALWTGSEVLLWGGQAGVGGATLGDGGRYEVATGRWRGLAKQGAPSPRRYHAAVWTGRELVVWGGDRGGPASAGLADGARVAPADEAWSPVAGGGPRARWAHTAVWTGTEMIVWGGLGCGNQPASLCGDGGRYDPNADHWRPVSLEGAPSPRVGHSAIWTGAEMVIFGGGPCASGACADTFAYDPARDRWRRLADGEPRGGHYAVWTGAELIVWGGRQGELERRNGFRLALTRP